MLNRSLRCRFEPGPAERTGRAAVSMVRSSFPASRTICVANVKGGSGKTPTALLLAELFATLRRESIVAADLNELRGTLGVRAGLQQPAPQAPIVIRLPRAVDDRRADTPVLQAPMELEPAHSLEPQVEDQAGRALAQPGAQELLGAAEAAGREPVGFEKCRHGFADTDVVVHDCYNTSSRCPGGRHVRIAPC